MKRKTETNEEQIAAVKIMDRGKDYFYNVQEKPESNPKAFAEFKKQKAEAQRAEFESVKKIWKAGVQGITQYFDHGEDVKFIRNSDKNEVIESEVSFVAMELIEGMHLADFIQNYEDHNKT